MTRTRKAAGAAAGLALLVAAALFLAPRLGWRGEEPPRLYPVPPFRLQERAGSPITLDDLRGRRWIADFIFTQCAGSCPVMTARMRRLRGEVPGDVRFVSFTVDPTHDTADVLAEYARRAGADERWLFVTGPQPDLLRLSTDGFKLAAFEVPKEEQAAQSDGPFLHSSRFVLVDGEGTIRGYYDSTEETEVQDLVRDVSRLPAGPR